MIWKDRNAVPLSEQHGSGLPLLALTAAALLAAVLLAAASGKALGPPPVPEELSGAAAPVLPESQPVVPLTGPYVVAIQAGHWLAAELPDELYRLRTSTGASSGGTREVDVNLGVARALAGRIEARGWRALLLPSTLPPGLRADVFVALHADWGASPSIQGWKVAAPWRPSPASLSLSSALAVALAGEAGLRQDTGGVTIGMRGYYAFSYRRFAHAISPFTPAAIVELGFLTNPRERALLVDHPDYWAGVLDRGIARFLAGFDRSRVADLRPMILPRLVAGPEGAAVFDSPKPEARRLWRLDAGVDVIAVDEREGWYEVFSRERRASGWVRTGDLTLRS